MKLIRVIVAVSSSYSTCVFAVSDLANTLQKISKILIGIIIILSPMISIAASNLSVSEKNGLPGIGSIKPPISRSQLS